ncbi:phosphoenolpyruvate carboxykinase (GTP) [Oligosphaera ethanolica]|uniref:Phosphoenolpyruvate carboxykinase [GTP] n=1 Tax=Oligosphaera ethanolica TaxID=760260 RepID=A0AAE4AQA2_9BACT|nr:phosphoenolpyruvate carboxykinase (GTP) [Oligosphaera ethanolica]MDQ0290232.1 phosphoenolpyruvate carboxykinase (GTP) [Oligosphaera ethanolica]
MQMTDIKNVELKSWLQKWVDLTTPDAVVICDGSQKQNDELCNQMVKSGTFIKLNNPPNSYLCRSDPDDVARVEERTYICSEKQEDAGPTNHWRAPADMRAEFDVLFKGCMKGRTLYVIPFSMGPVESPIAKFGVELTDSAYVVVNMSIMTRVSDTIIGKIDAGAPFVKCVHSVGMPLEDAKADLPWPSAPMEKKYITHFPETREIISFGSGYGGNALLGKKCFALRIASVQAHDEGWMAEHMLILKLTNPAGKVKFVGAAFPSACGKTNLAMMEPTIPGWKVETIGDDIAWMKFGEDGQLYAINPEAGFFGVAPGTSMHSNPNAMRTINAGNSIFTNCAITLDGKVWWEDHDDSPSELVDWVRRPWTPACGRKGAHPNARFTSPARQCPVIASEWEDPKGVPISAFLFGGRRKTVVPLVNEAKSWEHGVFMGATMASEMTAAARGGAGQLRFDPFAMLPFCGYHMGDYFKHWLNIGNKPGAKLPKIFYVNWFRRGADGHFMWPGFGDNSRVLEWIFNRCDNAVSAKETAIGLLPDPKTFDLKGLNMPQADIDELFGVDVEGWKAVLPQMEEHFAKFGDRLPAELPKQLNELKKRLG